MKNLKEYKNQPILSTRTRFFIDNYDGNGEIPEDIRIELEQYVRDIEPFVNAARINLVNQFKRVFKK